MGRNIRSVESINYSFVPNHRETMEALCQSALSGSEFRAVILILNQTNGYLREEDNIRPQFFEERACLAQDNLRRTLGRLRERNIISKQGETYRVLPPSEWSRSAFLSNRRVKNDTPSKPKRPRPAAHQLGNRVNNDTPAEQPHDTEDRVKNDTPTVLKMTRRRVKNDTVLACSKENYTKENSKENHPERAWDLQDVPGAPGGKPPPSPGGSSEIQDEFMRAYRQGWGLNPSARELAQIRDFSRELAGNGCPAPYVWEAFKEAAGQNKYSLCYVRAILLDWLGVERVRAPT
ncbi:MAG: replication protein [Chloroflexota bacterium]|nr:replication protein [Chloroflexota bacterium]